MPTTRRALRSLARSPLPNPATGQYLFLSSPVLAGTAATLGNGTLRLTPYLVETTINLDRLGGDIATIGEAGSKLRIGVYADNGACYPGALTLDAGQIAGDSATVQNITLAATLTLTPGIWWFGGAVQSAPTTQPTVRVTSTWTPPVPLGVGSSIPSAAAVLVGYSQTGVTGALPSNFTATVTTNGQAPRIHARIA